MLKRSFITFGVSAAFLAVTSIVGYLASYVPLGFVEIFSIATAILVVSGVLAVLLRKNKSATVLTMVLNAVSMGFYLRSWYINRKFDNPLWLMLLVSILAALYLIIFMLPLAVPVLRRHCALYLTFFTIVSIAGYVCLIVFTKTTWVSTLGYFGLLQLGFCIALIYKNQEPSAHLRALQLATYSVALCAIIIAIFVSGGDSLADCFDIPTGTDYSKKKKELPHLPQDK